MHVLIVNFEIAGIAEADYRQQVESIAPMFTQVPGLVSKIWLADAATNTYGGIYLFADAASREDYLNSEIVSSLKASPNFTNITARKFGTFEEATAITGGPLA
ncbi:MAG: YdhR family protein, partial [Chloroflexi bacterium]|nr:YdhR family protein [Chloroflexota bacterium]